MSDALVDTSDAKAFSTAGLQVGPMKPMLRWKVDFKGKMQEIRGNQVKSVSNPN